MVSTAFLIIGGGIIGISIAGQIKNRFPDAGVILIEKKLTAASTPALEIAVSFTQDSTIPPTAWKQSSPETGTKGWLNIATPEISQSINAENLS